MVKTFKRYNNTKKAVNKCWRLMWFTEEPLLSTSFLCCWQVENYPVLLTLCIVITRGRFFMQQQAMRQACGSCILYKERVSFKILCGIMVNIIATIACKRQRDRCFGFDFLPLVTNFYTNFYYKSIITVCYEHYYSVPYTETVFTVF